MNQSSATARKHLGRGCIVAAFVVIGWALAIHPIAFEYASREARAASDHKLGFFSAGMADLSSGWFSALLIVSATATSVSLWLFRDERAWRASGWIVLLACAGLLAVHALDDGPVSVIRNLWSAVTHPTSFHWPLDYFKVAVQNWGAWP